MASADVVGNAMRALAVGLGVALTWQLPLSAQERDPTLERISLALQQPAPITEGVFATETPAPPPVRFGPFTLVPPELRGEFVRVSFPIGEYVSKAFKGLAAANQRHQEAAARRRVEAALKHFLEQPPPD
jgi:hypothetical protein